MYLYIMVLALAMSSLVVAEDPGILSPTTLGDSESLETYILQTHPLHQPRNHPPLYRGKVPSLASSLWH
jgi:hypothetical protein